MTESSPPRRPPQRVPASKGAPQRAARQTAPGPVRGGSSGGSSGGSDAGPRARSPQAPVRTVQRRDLSPALFLPCAMGVEPLLQAEIEPLLAGLPLAVSAEKGGVLVQPTQRGRLPTDLPFDLSSELGATIVQAVFMLNLHSRLAQRVLWRVALGPGASEEQLYHLARSVEWGDWITPRHTLRVDTTARHSPLQSINFAGLRVKDAVCDQLREQHGERPSVDTRHPDLSLHLHLDGEVAHISVDTSGEALFKRGWREDKGEAPLKETLAAAMLAAAGWHGRPEDGPLLDPCCGSGTIAIEAAQIACGKAPGMHRHFAFERLLPFAGHEALWQRMRQQAKAQEHAPAVRIYTGDVSFRMTDFATRNAERAGVLHAIEFKTADALQRTPPASRGVLMFNPPYGERIEPKGTGHGGQHAARAPRAAREDFTDRDASDFFNRLASHWKKHYSGWTAWVLSPDMKLPSAMRLKESRRTVMFNGPIECRLFRFDLVSGSHRASPSGDAADLSTEPEPEPE